MDQPLDVTIIGAGMITVDQLLPSLYHLQRLRQVGEIRVVSRHSGSVQALAQHPTLCQAFPGQGFPTSGAGLGADHPLAYRDVLAALPPRQAVVVAVPDALHYEVVMAALQHDQHVLCVKPLFQCYAHTQEADTLARSKGLYLGVEYHKRFDRRSLIARRHYRQGHFGEFVMGEAKLLEPYCYRHSNFQNWFTVEQADPFTYVGCHYVDLVYFITGLRPVEVSVVTVPGRFPNGNVGYLWSHARVRFENGAWLSVINGLGYPDDGSGSNDQGMVLYCEGAGKTGMIRHDDQFRGVTHCYVEGIGPGGTHHNFVNPDYFRYVPWEGPGLQPIGYGYDSVAGHLHAIQRVEAVAAGLSGTAALAARQAALQEIDEQGLLATASNSAINDLVVEAARLSIARGGSSVRIRYEPAPGVGTDVGQD